MLIWHLMKEAILYLSVQGFLLLCKKIEEMDDLHRIILNIKLNQS